MHLFMCGPALSTQTSMSNHRREQHLINYSYLLSIWICSTSPSDPRKEECSWFWICIYRGSPFGRCARNCSHGGENHTSGVWAILKVSYIHRRRLRLDMKLTPAVCNFFHSAGVLQSKEPGVSKALSPSPAGAATQTNSNSPLPWEERCQRKKGTFIQRGSYLHSLKFDMVLFLYILMWFIY